MRTSNDKNKFLEQLREFPNISLVCKRIPIAKATIYRWRGKDEKFNEAVNKALALGRDGVTDLAESVIIGHMKKGSLRAAEYWLGNNEKRYIKPRLPLPRYSEYQGVSQINISLYKNKGKDKETYSKEVKPEDKTKE